ncbi:hypothetical protein BGZ49_006151, partial [Haplosporangium sp. Z 27]
MKVNQQPRQKWTLKKIILTITVLVVIVLGLTFGLVFGLRKHHDNNTDDNNIQFTESWNNPSEFMPSKNFTITNVPTTRYYEWTISEQTIAPDGLERKMLLVN